MPDEPVLSRHRLPRNYRIALALLWVTPLALLIGAILVGRGFTAALFHPRFLLPALLMLIPALYIWQEGVDVLPSGIIARVFWPRYYAYDCLETWYYDARADKRVMTVWDAGNRKVLECRAGHLTDLPALLRALKDNVRYRNWPR